MESPGEKSSKTRMASPYRYTPLDETRQEIRLMTLFPGSFDDPIVLSIRRTPLTKMQIPRFEALSYAWGNASDRQDIFIQKKSTLAATWRKVTSSSPMWKILSVTSNLSQALRYIRLKGQPRVLWADAVCVDQQNLDERSKQVTRMPDIYGSAKGTIAWFGPESSNSALAMKIIAYIGSRVIVDFKQDIIRLASDSYRSVDHFHESLQLDKETYRAIRELLSRSWFERLWILQEVHLGRGRTHMLCGFERTSREFFCNAVEFLCLYNISDPNRIGKLLDNVRITMTYKNNGSDALMDLVRRTRHLQCSDPRDKVYAVLNMASNKSSDIQSDYSKSTPEVFQSVLEHGLSKYESLQLLAYCSLPERKLNMPTWVPDWSAQSQIESIDEQCHTFITKACANLINSDILVTTGVQVTKIHELKNHLHREVPGATNELAEFIKKLVSAVDVSGPEMTLQSRIESLCRTLCCDIFAEKWHPPQEQLPSFPKLIGHVMNNFESPLDSLEEPSEVCSLYARYAKKMMTERALAIMVNGVFGLVPEDARPGDIICLIFGCDVPLVLRPDEDSTFKIVGECYVDGNMSGEPLLGQLPDNWIPVRRWLPGISRMCNDFLDGDTGRIQTDDPRLTEPLPVGWRIKSHDLEAALNWYVNEITGEDAGRIDPRLKPTELKEQRRIDIREFRLI